MFPLILPSQTSKPASARMYASASGSGLVSQLVLLQSRPCCRRTAGLGRVAMGGEKKGEQERRGEKEREQGKKGGEQEVTEED